MRAICEVHTARWFRRRRSQASIVVEPLGLDGRRDGIAAQTESVRVGWMTGKLTGWVVCSVSPRWPRALIRARRAIELDDRAVEF